MSGYSSDDFHGFDLSEFTAEDFAYIDANIASLSGSGSYGSSEVGPKLLEKRTRLDSEAFDAEDEEVYCANEASFRSDTFDLNLSSLTNDEFAALDERVSNKPPKPSGGPSIAIEIEERVDVPDTSNHEVEQSKHDNGTRKSRLPKSPLDQFRPYMALSVTDLTSPAWCEVQYDYGLRGKRSRPISERPKSFQSSTGKTIRPESNIVEKNDIQTRQGLAVHKELEREIKFEELQVDITSEETRWALRLVNMLACLKSIMGGFTREMPVFGVIHDEVVVGIMDEVIKKEVPKTQTSIAFKSIKRPSDQVQPSSSSKKLRISSPSPQTQIDSFFQSPKKERQPSQSSSPMDEEERTQKRNSPEYVLYIKDNKTREKPYVPSEGDMKSGRMQLMLYRRLLSDLISTNPPYDFSPFWNKLGVDSAAIFPTKFLVQAHLIEESSGFQSTCLDDLVSLWHSEIKDLNIVGVDPTLELVYRLRPSPGRRKKDHDLTTPTPPQTISDEERDLMIAIAASLEDVSASQTRGDITHTGPSTHIYKKNQLDCPDSGSEDMEFQRALAESITPKNVSKKAFDNSDLPETGRVDVSEKIGTRTSKGKEKESEAEEQGIRRFKVIGTKRFLHNDEELDKYLDHVLEWWRGERRPEGVPLDRTYRCSYCEYENDCEWRAEKAAEIRKKKRLDS